MKGSARCPVGSVTPTMGLQQFERRLERLVEGVFARAFRSGLQPVELGRRLTREMDASRTLGVRGTIAPNRFTYALSPKDMTRFASFEEALIRERADMARDHAREEGYVFVGPVEVVLQADEHMAAGAFTLTGQVEGAPGGPVGALVLGDGKRVALGDDPLTIGRLPECDVVVADKNVSRRHAELRRQDGQIVVVDLGSTNGTRVNGAGIKERVLADGDVITVGATEMRFEAS